MFYIFPNTWIDDSQEFRFVIEIGRNFVFFFSYNDKSNFAIVFLYLCFVYMLWEKLLGGEFMIYIIY